MTFKIYPINKLQKVVVVDERALKAKLRTRKCSLTVDCEYQADTRRLRLWNMMRAGKRIGTVTRLR